MSEIAPPAAPAGPVPDPVPAPRPEPGFCGERCRTGREALGWTRDRLAGRSGVSLATLSRIENGAPGRPEDLARLRAALEAEGVEFVDGPGGWDIRLHRVEEAPEAPG